MSVFDDFIVKVEELTKNVFDKVGMHQVFEERLALLKKCEEQYITKLHKNSLRRNLQKIDEDEDNITSNKPRKGSVDTNSGKLNSKGSKNIDKSAQIEKAIESTTPPPKKMNETETAPALNSKVTETAPALKSSENVTANSKKLSADKTQIQPTVELGERDVSEKRTKRNASAKASANINKQVNQNLNHKMRRPDTESNQKEKADGSKNSHSGKEETDNKENEINKLHIIKIKQEKMSIVPEDINDVVPIINPVSVKQERMEMPPPPKPAPQKSKRQTAKERATLQAEDPVEESVPDPPVRSSRVRGKKKDDTLSVAAPRQTRASSRACHDEDFVMPSAPPPKDARPKRTRAKKVQSETLDETSNLEITKSTRRTRTNRETVDIDQTKIDNDETKSDQENTTSEARTRRTRNVRASATVSEAIDVNAKTRPKRTRRANAVEKNSTISKPEPVEDVQTSQPEVIGIVSAKVTLEQESSSESPILTSKVKRFKKNPLEDTGDESLDKDRSSRGKRSLERHSDDRSNTHSNKEIDRGTRVLRSSLEKRNSLKGEADTPVTDNCQNQTVIISQNDNEPVTPVKKKMCLDETVVIDKGYKGNVIRETVVIESEKIHLNVALNETVTFDGAQDLKAENGNVSLLTDDNSEIEQTPPPIVMAPKKKDAPGSAVKERVQQFEEMTNGRITRTKTRAMSKQNEDELKEPPVAKAALFSSALLTKLKHMAQANTLKHMQSNSAIKPSRNNIVATGVKSFLPSSMSKATTIARAREQAEELRREKEKEREDPQKKKEAMLEAKREEQRRRREEKMAAACAAREHAAAQRRAAAELAAREREFRAAQITQEKADRMKEIEKKRLALERKVHETEERRRAEEAAKMAKLEEEQKRAAEQRRRNNEEAEKMKKEALVMEKEIAAARMHYQAKEKEEKRKKMLMKQRMEAEKASALLAAHVPPVHMADGFEFLCSDDSEDDDHDAKPKPTRVPPSWSRSKERWYQLSVQCKISTSLIDNLFSVGFHSPNLQEVFPAIEQRHLKRTSSAVWRTPPGKSLQTLKE